MGVIFSHLSQISSHCASKVGKRNVVLTAKASEVVSPTVCVGVPPLRIPAALYKVGRRENELERVGKKRHKRLYLLVIDVAGATVNKEIAALDSDFSHQLQVWKPSSES